MVRLSCRLSRILSFVLLCIWGSPALAAPETAAAPPVDKTLSPYFFVENGDKAIDQLPLDATKVDVAISGVIADVTVSQVYRNTGTRPINAKYVFPASTRAAVHGMRMAIGNQVIVAKIKEKEQAKKEYEAHKEAGKTASLLEEDRPNVFTMSVANIMPGDRIDVTLEYTELLVPEAGTYEFVYPTVVGPRYSNLPESGAPKKSSFVKTPYLDEGLAPTSTFDMSGTLSSAIPIQTMTSPSHKIRALQDNATLTRFSLDDSENHGNNRDFILRYGLSGNGIQSGLTLYDAGGEKFFLLVVQPPKRVAPESVPPREYVFVLDVSGSMEGFPLEIAKHLLRELVSGLRPVDTFNVVLFSGASHVLSPHSLPATAANIQAALSDISKERGGGGTELLPALQQAMSLSASAGVSRSFVVMTDGYIEADKNAIDYVRAHLGDANVFSFGIGSAVNRYLIEGIAKAGQGEPFVVTDPNAAKETADKFRSYVSAPVLTDVHVATDGFSTYDVEPASVPDVFAERPVVVYGKWRGKAAGTITLDGVSGNGRYTQRFDVGTVSPRPENRALAYLWARSQIGVLSDFGFGEPTDAEKAQVTALGLKYSLLTPYTSFIAVSEVVRNPRANATDVNQPLPLPAGVSADAVGDQTQTAAEPELLWLVALLLIALSARALARAARHPELVQ